MKESDGRFDPTVAPLVQLWRQALLREQVLDDGSADLRATVHDAAPTRALVGAVQRPRQRLKGREK